MTVAGDDAQSICSFRAATVRNILDFPKELSPKPADVITLDRNYRSTQPILAAANGVIELAKERLPKTSGPTVNQRSVLCLSWSKMRSTRRVTSSTRCFKIGKGACS